MKVELIAENVGAINTSGVSSFNTALDLKQYEHKIDMFTSKAFAFMLCLENVFPT